MRRERVMQGTDLPTSDHPNFKILNSITSPLLSPSQKPSTQHPFHLTTHPISAAKPAESDGSSFVEVGGATPKLHNLPNLKP